MLDLHGISRRAFDEIVSDEVTSQAIYNKRYRWPTWPGEQSGVTIGVGYDVGQQSKAQFLADWTGKIPPAMLAALAKCCGVTGLAAKPLAAKLRGVVDIPWDVALDVFSNGDVPRYLAIVHRALPNTEQLTPDSLGAILSIVFNRGASFSNAGPRYAEMRGIKAAMKAQDFARIPPLIRSMKRLWPAGSGLLARRDREADLFAHGLLLSHPFAVMAPAEEPVIPDPDMVACVQKRLRELNYFGVGKVDGSLTPQGATEDAILAFRNRNGLPLSTAIDAELIAALAVASPLQVSDERAATTVQDLREEKSETISFTDQVKGWGGKIFGGGAGTAGAGILAVVTDKATAISSAKEAVGGLGLTTQAVVIIVAIVLVLVLVAGAGLLVWHVANRIEQKRLADYRIGKNT